MKVIVNTESGLFYLDGKYVVKTMGDVIELPDKVARKDLGKKLVLEFVKPEYQDEDEEEDQPIKKKKKKKTPVE